jgi:hypothetical protein
VGFVPFSWDNLTNRGLIRVAPDRVLVWNEHQRRETVAYHGVPDNRVVITGAPRFDEFFAMRPSLPREAFCAAAGIDPGRPFLLYLCSSNFIAPNEVAFVRQWACAIRRSPHPALAGAGIVVRPHPAHPEPWEGQTLDGVENAVVWSQPVKVQADPSLFDSLSHCAAVVGLNTSAMIEAGILGKPVFTIETDEFAGGQEQTLHFHYLLARNGGLVEVAPDMTEHLDQLAAALADPSPGEARSRAFAARFVRPRGIDHAVAPIMADEIERLAAIRKRPQRTPLWHYPARAALYSALTRRARK